MAAELYEATERSLDSIANTLRGLECGPIQIAVLWQLRHLAERQTNGLWRLSISQRVAAAWIARNCPGVAGCCDHSAVRKAWQWWVDRGVLAVQVGRKSTTLFVHWDRLRDWIAKRESERDELPFFGLLDGESELDQWDIPRGPVVTGGDCCGLPVTGGESVVTGGDCCGLLRTAGDLQRKEEEKEEQTSSSSSFSSSSRSGDSPNQLVTSAVAECLRALPELPADVFTSRSDAALLALLQDWSVREGLADRCGHDVQAVAATVAGLILRARKASDPWSYWSRCVSQGVLRSVTQQGRAWIDHVKRAAGQVMR